MNEQRSYGKENKRISNFIWRNWGVSTNLIGFTSTLGVWGIAIAIIDKHQDIGFELFSLVFRLCGIVMIFLEISKLLDKLLSICASQESPIRQCWSFLLATDNWKRGLLYLGLSIVCFVNAKYGWEVILAGALMDFASILYFIKTFGETKHGEPYKYKLLSVT